MSTGELLDRTFALYRRHFVLFVGIMILPALFSVSMSLCMETLRSPATPAAAAAGTAVLGGTMVALALSALGYFAVASLALGATTFAVSEVYLGRQPGIRQSYHEVRRCAGRLIVLMISLALRVGGVFLLTIAAVGGLVSLPGFNRLQTWLVGSLILLAFFGGGASATYLLVRYSMSVPAMVLETLNGRQSLRRSVALTQHHRWRIFLLLLLGLVLNYSVAALFQGPFFAVLLISPRLAQSYWFDVAAQLAGTIGGILVAPVLLIAFALMYYDLRIRKEAFDLQLMLRRVEGEAAAAGS